MAQVTMKDDALPQIHLVRDTDLGVFAYELHTVTWGRAWDDAPLPLTVG